MKKKCALSLIIGMLVFMAACNNSVSDSSTIDIVGREQGSGTRTAFEELMDINTDENNLMTSNVGIKDGNGLVATYVAKNEAAIGYVSFATLEANIDDIHGLNIDGVQPTAENVLNGSYEMSRPFVMVYMNESVGAIESAFMDFLNSNQGLQALESAETIVDYTDAENFDVSKYGELNGSLVLGGSTSTERAIKSAAKVFTAMFPHVTYSYAATGSGSGIQNAQTGMYSLGFSSRMIKESELATGLQERTVCKDGIVFVVNKDNQVQNVTTEQVRNIYLGKIESWNELLK